MGRYVRRGSTGIALIDTSGDNPELKYVFDVADTGGRPNARTPYLFQYQAEHEQAVTAALMEKFDVGSAASFPDLIEEISNWLMDDYWIDHKQDILGIVDGSFLQDYDEENIRYAFHEAAVVSTTYTILSRCCLNPDEHFEHLDFMPVFDFNTPQTVGALGTAISQSSEAVLRQIEITVKKYERAKQAERSQNYEPTELHQERRLSDPQPVAEPAGESTPGQVRQNEKQYLQEHRPVLWNTMILSEKLYPHLREVEQTANRRMEQMMEELKKSAGVTEELKASDPMKWVGLMYNLQAQAEEVILRELIFG